MKMQTPILLITLWACFLVGSAAAQAPLDKKSVNVAGAEVIRVDNSVIVSFVLNVGDQVTQAGRSLIISPVLQNYGGQALLVPIIVRGSRAKSSSEIEAMQAARIDSSSPFYTANGQRVEYSASIAWQEWMDGSELVLHGINAGRDKATEVVIGTVAGNLLVGGVQSARPARSVAAVRTPGGQASSTGGTDREPVASQTAVQPSISPVSQAAVLPSTADRTALGQVPRLRTESVQAQSQNSADGQLPPVRTRYVRVEPSNREPVQAESSSAKPVQAVSVKNRDIQAQSSTTTPGQIPVGRTYIDQPNTSSSAAAVLPREYGAIQRSLRPLSVGDELSQKFAFVEPANSPSVADKVSSQLTFDYNMPLALETGSAAGQYETDRSIDMTQQGALFVNFQRGSHVIDRDLGDNNTILVDLISSIRLIESSSNARITRVVIGGFYQPEASSYEGDRLAAERAAALKRFLIANSTLKPQTIKISEGSVDWSMLRDLIARSSMPDKYKALDIIDNTPVWQRMDNLTKFNGGKPYRYIKKHFFPQLRRSGVYAKVYYENISF